MTQLIVPQNWPPDLPQWPLQQALQRYSSTHHGDYTKWAQAIAALPPLTHPSNSYGDIVSVAGEIVSDSNRDHLRECLMQLHPWRKGPFQIGDIHIDTEWHSDWKWSRIAPHLGDMQNERVLDIGCGNGYFGWRMLDAGAAEVIGIDPTLLFCMQHLAIQHYTQDLRNWVLPLKVEELPASVQFDTVLSMGVIYHRRDPVEHTEQLAALTRPGGRVILESLVVEGESDLIPADRYARMRNVWCVPTVASMATWLARAGLRDVQVLDVTKTTTAEQRSTPWMTFESLAQTLQAEDDSRTIEGHPAPLRAVLMAHKP